MQDKETLTSIFRQKTDEIAKFITSNKTIIFISFLICFLTYGFEMTNYTLSIDEERMFGYKDYIGFGRFGVIIFKYLFGHVSTVGSYSAILAVIFLFLSALILCNQVFKLNPEKPAASFILLSIFVTFPFNADYIVFSTYSFEVSIGLFFATLSICFMMDNLLYKASGLKMIVSIFFIFYAVSIYQSFIAYYMVGLFFFLLMHTLNENIKGHPIKLKEYFVMVIRAGVSLIIAVIIYLIVNKFLQEYFHAKSPYIDSFFNWNKQNINVIIFNLLAYYKAQIEGSTGGNFNILTMPITFAFDIIILLCILLNKKYRNMPALLSFIGFNISVLLMNLALGNYTPNRSSFQTTLFVSAIWALLYTYCTSYKLLKLRVPFYILTIIIVFFQLKITNQLFFSDYLKYQQDYILATKISMKIEELGYGEAPQLPVVPIGYHPSKLLPPEYGVFSEIAGKPVTSFFAHDNGNIFRMNKFFEQLGYNYILPTSEQVEQAKKLSEDMPFWPDKGSVDVKKDIIIVNLPSNIAHVQNKIVTNLSLIPNRKLESYNIQNVKVDNNINIDGFAFINDFPSQRSKIYLELKSADNSYLLNTSVVLRSDLNKQIKDVKVNLDSAGFNLFAEKKNIKPGEYSLGIYVVNGDIVAYVQTDYVVNVN